MTLIATIAVLLVAIAPSLFHCCSRWSSGRSRWGRKTFGLDSRIRRSIEGNSAREPGPSTNGFPRRGARVGRAPSVARVPIEIFFLALP